MTLCWSYYLILDISKFSFQPQMALYYIEISCQITTIALPPLCWAYYLIFYTNKFSFQTKEICLHMILEKVKLLGTNSPKVDLNIVFTLLLLSYIKAYSSAAAAFCAPLYIVQECAYISHWKKFIICGIVEKNQNFTLQKNNICSVKLEIYLLKKENFSALRAEDIFILSNSVLWRLFPKIHHQILEGYGILIQNRDPWSC